MFPPAVTTQCPAAPALAPGALRLRACPHCPPEVVTSVDCSLAALFSDGVAVVPCPLLLPPNQPRRGNIPAAAVRPVTAARGKATPAETTHGHSPAPGCAQRRVLHKELVRPTGLPTVGLRHPRGTDEGGEANALSFKSGGRAHWMCSPPARSGLLLRHRRLFQPQPAAFL